MSNPATEVYASLYSDLTLAAKAVGAVGAVVGAVANAVLYACSTAATAAFWLFAMSANLSFGMETLTVPVVLAVGVTTKV